MDSAGLQIFSATADQRALLGEETFLQTHFRIAMRTGGNGQLKGRLSEEDLLEHLLDTRPIRPGNRIFVLYGAAGSGKSELLKWLLYQMARRQPGRADAVVRVSRSELDVIQIVERFQKLLSGRYFETQTHSRWADLASKPLTLAKLLTISALERLLQRDEEINALFYWLCPAIQNNLERSLAVAEGLGQSETMLELFRQEDWSALAEQTELMELVDPEALRQALVDAFRYQLLENVHLPNTLQLLGKDIADRHGIRPVLLIDDLVRSLNLFAGDLMDYFMTLEAGNWDIVVGLTPASLQTHVRGRQLLERIAYLDTIDDRVQKLWLSDDFGHESYFLSQENCHEFAVHYLEAFRRLNGMECRFCPQSQKCMNLGSSQKGSFLAPFNRPVLQRIFRQLPESKGKARFFLQAVETVISRLQSGERVEDAFLTTVKSEIMARGIQQSEQALVELYGELNEGEILATVDPGVGLFFELQLQEKYPVEPMTVRLQDDKTQLPDTTYHSQQGSDPQKIAIRDWLEGQSVNRQLLRPVRQGIARWLREVGAPNWLGRMHIARPKGILRWQQTYLDLPYPICLEGVDEPTAGLTIGRDVGVLAFDFARYATAKGSAAKDLARDIAMNSQTPMVMYDAFQMRNMLQKRLSAQLGMQTEQAVLHLFLFVLCINGDLRLPPGFPPESVRWLAGERRRRTPWRTKVANHTCSQLLDLFDDFFRLRENIYDGPLVSKLLPEGSKIAPLTPLLNIDTASIEAGYLLGNRPLAISLTEIQNIVKLWQDPDTNSPQLSKAAQSTVTTLLSAGASGISLHDIPLATVHEIQTFLPEIYSRLSIRLQD